MNRKERRAASSRAGPLPQGIDALGAEARQRFDQGRFAQAQKICREVIERAPAHVESLNLLGLIAQDAGRHTAAVRFFEKAIAADPYNAACHFNLGTSHQVLNERARAAGDFREAIALGLGGRDAGNFMLQSPVIAACLDRIAAAWPRRPGTAELFGAPGIAALANDVFLCCALETTKFTRIALETFFTEARYALFQIAAAAAPDWRGVEPSVADFCAALAQQCFINEYIYALGDEEARQAVALREALAEALNAAADVPPLLIAIVAAYAPLRALTNAQALLQRQWPDALAGLLRQQIEEPREEAKDRDAIPALTAIAEDSAVQRQYEENPYPRWTMMPKDAPAPDGENARRFGPEGDVPPADILVAGCGTGHHSITTAMLYPEANLLAIDIIPSCTEIDSSDVIAGLDPAIHPLERKDFFCDGCLGQARA